MTTPLIGPDGPVTPLPPPPRSFDDWLTEMLRVPLDETDDVGKRQSFGSRSEAGRYAANIRWATLAHRGTDDVDAAISALHNGEIVNVSPETGHQIMRRMSTDPVMVRMENMHVNGRDLMDGNLDIPRDRMPQIPASHKMEFFAELQAEGVMARPMRVDPTTLRPTQNEVLINRSGRLMTKMMEGSYDDAAEKYITVSADGYILDGHHRWGGALGAQMADPTATLGVWKIDLPADALIARAAKFNQDHGIESIGLHEEKGGGVFKQAVRLRLSALRGSLRGDGHVPYDHPR